ncbi:MAG: sulfatase-like hydrolase/transferase, partial [Caldisericota bacterium]|nr:sulfatase-like hydrolase/transferase [Caldisericota bacterium]
PPRFEHFKPVCKTSQLDQCDQQSIVNAYDNSIRYTDHVLSRTLELLKENSPRFDTAMIYISDHGESLGEKGLYLHGMPYSLAPSEQKRIPMLTWMRREDALAWGLDADCMRRQLNNSLTHDSLYHSVLGLMGVGTSVYQPTQDIFSSCRSGLNSPALKGTAHDYRSATRQ